MKVRLLAMTTKLMSPFGWPLDLMLGSGLTQMIELEPCSEEDLEAQLADDGPGHVAMRVDHRFVKPLLVAKKTLNGEIRARAFKEDVVVLYRYATDIKSVVDRSA